MSTELKRIGYTNEMCLQGMEELIQEAFIPVHTIRPDVLGGRYNLVGPTGEIIPPHDWDSVIQPGWTVTMHVWSTTEKEAQELMKANHHLLGTFQDQYDASPSQDLKESRVGDQRSPSVKKHNCPYCSRKFKRHYNLESHLLTHREKPFHCGKCDKRFHRRHDLKRHTKLHTAYLCLECNRSFAGGDALARHKEQGQCANRKTSTNHFNGDGDFDREESRARIDSTDGSMDSNLAERKSKGLNIPNHNDRVTAKTKSKDMNTSNRNNLVTAEHVLKGLSTLNDNDLVTAEPMSKVLNPPNHNARVIHHQGYTMVELDNGLVRLKWKCVS